MAGRRREGIHVHARERVTAEESAHARVRESVVWLQESAHGVRESHGCRGWV